jgi:coenzyme F420-reducing hydrogenase gamma subunit
MVLPGCPIDREEFARDRSRCRGVFRNCPITRCVECKLNENVLYHRGQTCLGAITRAGCGAICPTYGDPCEGCRGLIPNPNLDAMQSVLYENGLKFSDIQARMTMFGTYQLMQREAQAEKA